MIEPDKLRPELVDPIVRSLPLRATETYSALANFLNALLADDEAMERAIRAFMSVFAPSWTGPIYSEHGDAVRAAIIAAVTVPS